ncbi:hypothetical protein FW778_08400 [Ginsengibacter hankyongi]|uniref:Carboxypeptidase-like regulatory domain-containing protein n=1 Tax=Ginsengibacter hankyongi TaxID=2607284 RepID=A0A5J5IR33_9BACT|nr:hypothetical protein [Ginsengibacter hankyongi]KAA9042022.1 hypothetical protein FW778_08400 [Ginsengibacter hankyongi]
MKKIILSRLLPVVFLLLSLQLSKSFGQVRISGTVYDSTKLYGVPNVVVTSTSGSEVITDSLGAYHINVPESDSISFFFRGKSTLKFPVKSITDYTSFDISLRVRINAKYKLLRGVTVFSNTYHRDSTENRMEYSKIFNYEKPGIQSSFEPGGAAGLDLDALIGMFSVRRRKENLAFQRRLVEDEQDRYVNYRFSPKVVHRITGLSGDTLTRYMKLYMPSYQFVVSSTLAEFYQYILNTSYAFKKEEGIQ